MINIILTLKVDTKTNILGRKSPAIILKGTKICLW